MANISKYLQAPNTKEFNVHEQQLSKADLAQTISDEVSKKSSLRLLSGLGIGLMIDNLAFFMTKPAASFSHSELYTRAIITVTSPWIAIGLSHFAEKNADHATRALEVLSGEIGERPKVELTTAVQNP